MFNKTEGQIIPDFLQCYCMWCDYLCRSSSLGVGRGANNSTP